MVFLFSNSALKKRHWEEINDTIGVELDLESEDLTLGELLGMGVDKSMDQIQEIAGRAGAEQVGELTTRSGSYGIVLVFGGDA